MDNIWYRTTRVQKYHMIQILRIPREIDHVNVTRPYWWLINIVQVMANHKVIISYYTNMKLMLHETVYMS